MQVYLSKFTQVSEVRLLLIFALRGSLYFQKLKPLVVSQFFNIRRNRYRLNEQALAIVEALVNYPTHKGMGLVILSPRRADHNRLIDRSPKF